MAPGIQISIMNRVVPLDCALVDEWRAYQSRAFAGAVSFDGSRSLIDFKSGVIRFVDNKRINPLHLWLAFCYLALGPFNFAFICINFATLPTWDPPSSMNPAAWGVVQLQYILDILEFAVMMVCWAAILWPTLRYALRYMYRGGTQRRLSRTLRKLHDRWGHLQLSALSGLELLSMRADGERGLVQCAR